VNKKNRHPLQSGDLIALTSHAGPSPLPTWDAKHDYFDSVSIDAGTVLLVVHVEIDARNELMSWATCILPDGSVRIFFLFMEDWRRIRRAVAIFQRT
jgi:hypothetical protein